MLVVYKKISLEELKKMSENMFGLVKAVVDIEKNIMAVDSQMHADLEQFLLEEYESNQANLWGINLHPTEFPNLDWVEFDSMINLRPSWGNRSRGVDDPKIQEKIRLIVTNLVSP